MLIEIQLLHDATSCASKMLTIDFYFHVLIIEKDQLTMPDFSEAQYLRVSPILDEVVALKEGQSVTLAVSLDFSSTVTVSLPDISWSKVYAV